MLVDIWVGYSEYVAPKFLYMSPGIGRDIDVNRDIDMGRERGERQEEK